MTPASGGPVSLLLPITDLNQVGDARRTIATMGTVAGLDATMQGELAIVVSEIATNLARHAKHGRIFARVLTDAGVADGVEVVAVDEGPGMGNIATFLRDGHSTGGTAGKGLGAISRMADEFDMHSLPGIGTTLVIRMWSAAGRVRRLADRMEDGVQCRALDGETACGDAWAIHRDGTRTIVCLADGLGHGHEAAIAAEAMLRVFRAHVTSSPVDILRLGNEALRSTRGAAVTIAELSGATRTVRVAGIGNVAAMIVGPAGSRSCVVMPGIVGHQARNAHELSYPWIPGSAVVLHSDGLSSRWQLTRFPGLADKHPALITATLAREYTRGRDDATIVAIKDARGLGARVP